MCQEKKNLPLNWYSSMQKKNEKDSDNFWKSVIGVVRLLNLEQYVHLPKNFFLWKVAIYHSIKQLFDTEAANNFSNVICSFSLFYY